MPTYYINADTGNDSTGTGTSGAPWKTISKAHTSAAAGDTIICQDSVAAYTWGNQTFTKGLTIQGQRDNGSGAVFDALNVAVIYSISLGSGENISFSKLKFYNRAMASTDVFQLLTSFL